MSKQLSFCLGGPALAMNAKERPDTVNIDELDDAFKSCKLVITGTSWANDLEHRARKIAMEKGIPSIAVLDHWVNYKERFNWNGEEVLPNSIWVSDSEAKLTASQTFPDLPVKQLRNTWLDNLTKEVKMLRAKQFIDAPKLPAKNLLYLLEPLRDRKTGSNNGQEFVALEYWLKKISTLMATGYVADQRENLEIYIRPHPSERPGKYDSWVRKHLRDWPLRLDLDDNLAKSLSRADLIFGCETQALIAGMKCNLTAISTLPPDLPQCRLPHSDLLHLKSIEIEEASSR